MVLISLYAMDLRDCSVGGLKDSLTRRIQTAGIGIDIPDVDPIGEVAPRYRYTDPSLVFLSFSPLNLT